MVRRGNGSEWGQHSSCHLRCHYFLKSDEQEVIDECLLRLPICPPVQSTYLRGKQVFSLWVGIIHTHSIFTVSPFLIDPAKGISGCHLLWSWGCFSAGMPSETLHTFLIPVRPIVKVSMGSRWGNLVVKRNWKGRLSCSKVEEMRKRGKFKSENGISPALRELVIYWPSIYL
jgi:hypothetical protein